MGPSDVIERSTGRSSTRLVQVQVHEDLAVPGALTTVPEATGVIVLASVASSEGASPFGPSNDAMASELQRGGFDTLLLELLTPAESEDPRAALEVDRLTQRLVGARRSLHRRPDIAALPVGLHGAGIGAAAALRATAALGEAVTAVVARSARPELAVRALSGVRAPTLLIVGGRDGIVLRRNIEALARLHCERHLEVVRDAAEPLDGPDPSAHVQQAARDWFTVHLTGRGRPTER